MAIQEHVFADFGGALNLSADLTKIPDRECILADNCVFDDLGNVAATGGSTKQNSGAYADSGITNVHSLHINPTIRHIAGVGNDVFQGTALGSLALLSDEANSAAKKMTFAELLRRVYYETNHTPRFVDNNGIAHTVDWAPPLGSAVNTSATNPGTSANDAVNGGTINWANPNNAFTSDNVYATAALNALEVSKLLVLTNFGFAIPSGATILGIKLEVERKQSTLNGPIIDSSIRVMKASVPVGTDAVVVSTWPDADAYATYGSATDLWGTTWTAAEINASGFGCGIAAINSVSPGGVETASVDHARITIYYRGGAATLAVGVAGNPNGTYTYKITFGAVTGEESQASEATASIAPASQAVNFSAIGLGDSKTTKRFIYRKGGGLTFYYRVGTISDNTATTFVDNYSDTQALTDAIVLAGEVEGDKANTRIGATAAVRYPAIYYTRIFWADQTSGQENRLLWSKVGQPFAYPSAHFLDVGDAKPITRIVPFLDDLIIFKTDSIWRLTGNTESAFQLVRTPATEGCDLPLTVVKLQDRIVFTNSKGVWYFDGVTSRAATNRLDKFFTGQTVNGIAPIVVNATTDSLAEAAVSSGKYYLAYSTNGTSNGRILVLDIDGGTISMRTVAALCLAADPVTGDVYYGDSSGFIKTLDDLAATNDATASVSWAFQSKFYDQRRGSNKSYVGLELEIDTSSQSVTPTAYFDGDTTTGVALAAVSTAKRDVVYVPIVTAAARKARSISVRVSGTLATINESGSPAVTLYGGKIYIEELKQRSRTSVG